MSKSIVEFLREYYEETKQRNPSYSLRAFANKLKINSSSLTQILNGKRKLTFESADSLLGELDIPLEVKNSLLLSISSESNYQDGKFAQKLLSESELSMITDWRFYAILSAMELYQGGTSIDQLTQTLNIENSTILTKLTILEQLGLVESTDQQRTRFLLTGNSLTTSNDIPSNALIEAHEVHLHKALEQLGKTGRVADYSGITMAISSKKLAEAKRRIREFRRSLAQFLCDDGQNDAVYRVQIQLFPLVEKKED